MVHTRAYDCPAEADPNAVKRALAALNPGSIVQTMKPFGASNEFFFEMVAAQTARARASGVLLANKPEVDFLLRLAGTSQISEAIGRLGSRSGDRFLAVVASEKPIRTPHDLVHNELGRRRLSRKELEMVEKAALLNVTRG